MIVIKCSLHVLIVFKVDQNVFNYEFLILTSDTKIISKFTHINNITC